MVRFRRRRRDVGTFEAPPPAPPPTLEHLIGEGMLIAESAARMALKNHIIVRVLRDHADFDRAALRAFAAETLRDLAAQEDEYATRLRDRLDSEVPDPFAEWDDDFRDDTSRAERRESVHRGLAARLRAFAADTDALDALLDASRSAAWDEIQPGLVARAVTPGKDERYGLEREERVATLIALDLTELAVERNVALDDL